MTGVGAGVTGLAAGDLVALDNIMACGHCPQCRRARPQFCATMRALGVTASMSWPCGGFDVVIDATGSVDVLTACTRLLGIGGTLFVYGMAPETASLAISPYDIFRRGTRGA